MRKSFQQFILTGLLLALFLPVVAQTNVTDAQGRKQGEWVVTYPNSKAIRYKGQFKDDKPYGKFRYYFGNGNPMSVMEFDESGKTSKAILYHESGNIMSEGKFVGRDKSGTWKYYGEDGKLKSEENFEKGKKEGLAKVFFDDGKVAETVQYENDVKVGDWVTYYDNGQIREEARYVAGKMEGTYTKYFKDGKVLATGSYTAGLKSGGWKYYLDNGNLEAQELWKAGKMVKTKKENGDVLVNYESGRPKSKHTYVGGKLHGPFIEYYDNGTFKTERVQGDREKGEPDDLKQVLEGQAMKRSGKYVKGNLHGKVTYYNEGGVKTKVETYENGTLVSTE